MPVQDPDNYINVLTRLRNLLIEIEEPFTDRHFFDIVLQGLTEKYRDVRLMTWKDPDFDMSVLLCVTFTWTGCRGTRREG